MKTYKLLIAALLGCSVMAHADIPAGYYNSLEGMKGPELKTAVYQIIRNLTTVSSYSALPQYFQVTDVYPESTRWWDMYSDIPLYAPSFWGLNREHSFPKSWWGGLTNITAYVDLNHLYPSEAEANQAKSNYPLGTVNTNSNVQFDNGVVKVGYAVAGQGGSARFVFEPNDEYKGDFARTYFYMVTCYQDLTWNQQYMYMLQQNAYPTLKDWAVELLLKWSREDPVSDKEKNRNEAVYRFQNNRNPFIDFPSLAEYIWGTKVDEAFHLSEAGVLPEPVGDPNLITPVQDMALDFGQVAIGKSIDAKLFFHGENISAPLSLKVYRNDAAMFSIPTNSIAANLVNSADGYWLTVKYTPTELGTHTSRLLISDGGLDGSRGVELRGECLEVPTLNPCVALPPANFTGNSYLASWTTPDDVVDYFVVTLTSYTNGDAVTEELVAEDTSLTIEDFDLCDSQSYYVQSVRLGYYSDPSNVIFVDHSGIASIVDEQPLAVVGFDGGLRLICSAMQTGCRVFDSTGKLVAYLDQIDNNAEIMLPSGIYLIVTDQSRKPIKAAVK